MWTGKDGFRKIFVFAKKLVYADTRFSNFAIEYLLENKKVRERVFACSYRAQVECFKQNKNGRKSRDTVP